MRRLELIGIDCRLSAKDTLLLCTFAMHALHLLHMSETMANAVVATYALSGSRVKDYGSYDEVTSWFQA